MQIWWQLLVVSRYPENPDPDRSGSGSRSRTDLRSNPEPDSGLKKIKKIKIFLNFFSKLSFLAPNYDLPVCQLYDIVLFPTSFEASINTDDQKNKKIKIIIIIIFWSIPNPIPNPRDFGSKIPIPIPNPKTHPATPLIYSSSNKALLHLIT